jgi:2-methylcitrate dehydratase PrpD
MHGITSRLAGLVSDARWDALPPEVVHETKRQLLDSIGCAYAATAVEKGRVSIEFARLLGTSGNSSILGVRGKVACTNAAFANGELINAMDFDAVVAGYGHVSPFVIPPALALAEQQGRSGKDLLLALALSHEVAIRATRTLAGGRSVVTDGPDKGKVVKPAVHGMSIVTFGAAVAASKMLELRREAMAHAIGIAGHWSPVASMVKWSNTIPSSTAKYCSAGWIAQIGVSAALLAKGGYRGDTTVLDTEYGYSRFVGSDVWKPEALFSDFGVEWTTLQTIYKLFPCCRAFSGAIECLLAIMQDNDLTPDNIESVECLLDPFLESPIFKDNIIVSHVDAQFNLPFVLAAAAYNVEMVDWQSETTLRDPRISQFMSKVAYRTHAESDFGQATLNKPTARPSVVEVAAHGKRFSREASYSRGAYTPAEMRLTDAELCRKFAQNLRRSFEPVAIERLTNLIFDIEKVDDVSAQLTPIFQECG